MGSSLNYGPGLGPQYTTAPLYIGKRDPDFDYYPQLGPQPGRLCNEVEEAICLCEDAQLDALVQTSGIFKLLGPTIYPKPYPLKP